MFLVYSNTHWIEMFSQLIWTLSFELTQQIHLVWTHYTVWLQQHIRKVPWNNKKHGQKYTERKKRKGIKRSRRHCARQASIAWGRQISRKETQLACCLELREGDGRGGGGRKKEGATVTVAISCKHELHTEVAKLHGCRDKKYFAKVYHNVDQCWLKNH